MKTVRIRKKNKLLILKSLQNLKRLSKNVKLRKRQKGELKRLLKPKERQMSMSKNKLDLPKLNQ